MAVLPGPIGPYNNGEMAVHRATKNSRVALPISKESGSTHNADPYSATLIGTRDALL